MAETKTTTAQQAYAQTLLERADRWARGIRKDGVRFITFVSSRTRPGGEPVYYYTRADGQTDACTCPGFYHRGECSHVLAVKADNERKAQQQTTYHEQLRERERVLRLLGWEKEEYRDDPKWAKLSEWVERAERGGGR